ncbi:class I SAM-dependent methyltransferase [Paenibacillus alginolyticus]|uniref:Class I SAM-dependent methyltransferase n=1 Tax=Paenibacillus alginolyticus TaxID=59839 RepID=A0ABT4GEN0_9BACL|nr:MULTISPECIES: class I SAM-dependent methyltransferase [Paenibacillus]MCY9664406.1 class I SAM-dependent methyltransferase [Paenibacillus alginolyticus]MCY9694642.1 class I SAM-dependent methyltransferase [Paenibacillus alginolyticus]MEC0142958.1 class I SAM-dependent methyltransferase [Paenibacillus alginolyticus]NRF94968.1 class I SAM-dependent methyltransferase [Paenibacillus frigoriresistens]
MSEHYYTERPTVKRDVQTMQEVLRGKTYTFLTDAGVFSKKGVDYGSKHLIETMQLREDAKVLDVGCGYGPIGLSAAVMCPKGHVTMVDINERAVELSADNAKRNGIANVTILQSDLLEQVKEQRFDTVLTNPPIRAGKEVVHRIFSDAYDCLVEGGSIWVVIQKKQGAPSAMKKLESIYSEVTEVSKDKGYKILKATK